MNISRYIDSFASKSHRYKPYSKIYKALLQEDKAYSLRSQPGYEESEYLPLTLRSCVQAYPHNKDSAIALFKDLVMYLEEQDVPVPEIEFPPIPVSNSFERLMFIAKYLQDKDNSISGLPDLLWTSARTIEEDLARLRGIDDPIQVCGRKFYIPDTNRQDGRIQFPSTAHPIFLAENLTQILILLKGLKSMAENPLYKPYATESAREIWNQLSAYARNRIRTVFRELMPEDLLWYESLAEVNGDNRFHTEEVCSRIYNKGAGVLLDCMKNGKSFCMEYEEEGKTNLYKDCRMEAGSYCAEPFSIVVNCSGGRKKILIDAVVKSAYSIEELAAE